MRHVLGASATDEDVKAAIVARELESPELESPLLREDYMKLGEEEWADDDDAIATVAELQRRYSRKLQAATRQPKAATAASTVSTSGSSSSGAPPGKRPFALFAHRGLTQKEAKAYMPPGTTITKIATRDRG